MELQLQGDSAQGEKEEQQEELKAKYGDKMSPEMEAEMAESRALWEKVPDEELENLFK